MYIALWKYEVRPENSKEYVETYKETGRWSDLFKKHAGYFRSRLFKHVDHYLLIDEWKSKKDYEAFKIEFAREYAEMSDSCRCLYLTEEKIGEFLEID